MEKQNRLRLDQESKESMDDIHSLNDRFIDQIKVSDIEIEDEIPFSPALLNEAYSEEEPEYTTEDLIWKNPNYNPSK